VEVLYEGRRNRGFNSSRETMCVFGLKYLECSIGCFMWGELSDDNDGSDGKPRCSTCSLQLQGLVRVMKASGM